MRKIIEVFKSRKDFDKRVALAFSGKTKSPDKNTIKISKFGKSELWEF